MSNREEDSGRLLLLQGLSEPLGACPAPRIHILNQASPLMTRPGRFIIFRAFVFVARYVPAPAAFC